MNPASLSRRIYRLVDSTLTYATRTMSIDHERREVPHPTLNEVLQCQVSSWYPIFSNLPPNPLGRTNVTIKSIIVEVSPALRDYLLSDGVELPIGVQTSGMLAFRKNDSDDSSDSCWSSDSDDVVEEALGNSNRRQPHAFNELNQQIDDAIRTLSGKVSPKLNWSAPKDAVWINSGTMACQTVGDVYLLLKSSDFCSYDLQHALVDVCDVESFNESAEGQPFCWQIVLRKWCNLYPSQEFRCFCRCGSIVAISQRNHSQHFDHLVRDQFLVRSLLTEFFDEIIKPNFAAGVENYVSDVYVDKKERVWLIDFNVWGHRTDALLYEWAELTSLPNIDQPIMRVVETEKEVRSDPLASYRAPIDIVHIASMTSGDANHFQGFMDLCERSDEREDELLGDSIVEGEGRHDTIEDER